MASPLRTSPKARPAEGAPLADAVVVGNRRTLRLKGTMPLWVAGAAPASHFGRSRGGGQGGPRSRSGWNPRHRRDAFHQLPGGHKAGPLPHASPRFYGGLKPIAPGQQRLRPTIFPFGFAEFLASSKSPVFAVLRSRSGPCRCRPGPTGFFEPHRGEHVRQRASCPRR